MIGVFHFVQVDAHWCAPWRRSCYLNSADTP